MMTTGKRDHDDRQQNGQRSQPDMPRADWVNWQWTVNLHFNLHFSFQFSALKLGSAINLIQNPILCDQCNQTLLRFSRRVSKSY